VSIFKKLDERQVTFLLKQQNKDGWWGNYAGTTDAKHAATYATSLAMIALSAVTKSDQLSTALRPAIQKALRAASDWLRASNRAVPADNGK
jgi:squalene cyclase